MLVAWPAVGRCPIEPLHRGRPRRRWPSRPHAPRHRVRQQGTALPDSARAIATRPTRRRLRLRPGTKPVEAQLPLVAAAIAGPLLVAIAAQQGTVAARRHALSTVDARAPAWASVSRVEYPVPTRLGPRRAARERRAGSGCHPVPGSGARAANGARRDAPRALRTGARGAVGRRPHVAGGRLRRWPGNVRPARRPPVLVTLRSAAAALPRSNRRGDTTEPAGASAGRHGVPDVRRRARTGRFLPPLSNCRTHPDRDTDSALRPDTWRDHGRAPHAPESPTG